MEKPLFAGKSLTYLNNTKNFIKGFKKTAFKIGLIPARAGQNPRQGLPNKKVDNKVYRNQQDQVVLPSQNDRFRRNILTTQVSCRNLGLP